MLDKLRYGKQYGYEVLFKRQPQQASGKIGLLIGELGLPEAYEYPFYRNFMLHVFDYSLPPLVKPLVLADRGMGLIDPDRPLARAAFKPESLIDPYGSFTNQAGVPYAACAVEWRPANLKNPWDHGYFLYKGEGPSGAPDICDKVGAKVAGWYYGKLIPEKKVAWRSQLRKVYEAAAEALGGQFPGAEFRNVHYLQPETVRQAIEELLAAGCQTLIYQGLTCPLYTDFEDYGYVLPLLHNLVRGRACVIMADQLGNQPAMRAAYLALLRDRLKELPETASLLVILSRHGHPFKKETQDVRAHLYRQPLEAGVRQVLGARPGKWDVVWSFDEYADAFRDPQRTKLETQAAYCKAIAEGYDYALELPTEFPAENTDLMIFHAMKKFCVFQDYDPHQPVPYPDWEKPLVRTYHQGGTTGIYAGTPVGPYRKYVVEAVIASIAQVAQR